MSERAEFHVVGEPLDGTPLHYTASGLDYVYLTNGFTVEDDPKYGRIITIKNVDDLHRMIGLYAVTRRRALRGAEFRFLRKQMGYKQRQLAEDLGVDEQTIANYEKNKKIPPTSDKLMRMTFLLWLTPEDARAEFLKRLNEEMKKHHQEIGDDAVPDADTQATIARQWQVQAGVDHDAVCLAM